MFDLSMAAALKNMEKPDEVALDIGVRMGQRVPYPSLSRQMHDALWPLARKHFGHALTVGEIQLQKAEPLVAAQERYVEVELT